jgi:hypothetical protein
MTELSIILPSIRKNKLERVYNSILASTKRSFELIVVGPFELPGCLQYKDNVKYAKDLGSPVRCSNIGAMMAEGKYIKWFADDAVYLPDSIDNNIDELEKMPFNIKNVVTHGYFEGVDGTQKNLQPNSYYKLGNGPSLMRSPYLNPDWWLFNTVIMHREFFDELGAWDCRFETPFVAHTDLAVRAQELGAIMKWTKYQISDTDWMPGRSGDHAAIHDGQLDHDEPLFSNLYRNPTWKLTRPLRLDIMNWKDSPAIWKRRFSKIPEKYEELLANE